MPFPDESFDAVLLQNVLHHVTGRTVAENRKNLATCLQELQRVVRPEGKVVMIESTVGRLFYAFESAVFGLASAIKRGGHPVTFQFTPRHILDAAAGAGLEVAEFTFVPLGGWVLQFGKVWPSWLTPVKPMKLVLRRRTKG